MLKTTHLAHHGQHRNVQTGTLANDCKDRELDANTLGKAAFPHLIAGVGVTSLNSPTDSVVPDIHDSVPADEDTVKEGNELKDGIKNQPLDQYRSEGDDNESDIQPNEQLVGRIAVLFVCTWLCERHKRAMTERIKEFL